MSGTVRLRCSKTRLEPGRQSSRASLQMQQAVALKLTNDADGGVALKGDTGGALRRANTQSVEVVPVSDTARFVILTCAVILPPASTPRISS